MSLKYLAQLIPTMNSYYIKKHPYAIFFCRLFQLFDPNPVPYNMAIFLVKARMEFHTLIDKFDRFRLSFGKKPSGFRSKNHGKAAFEVAGTGGLALLSDVIDSIYNLFSTDK